MNMPASLWGIRSYGSGMTHAAEMAMRWRSQAHFLEEQAAAANVENYQSYARTADGWMQTIGNIMGRMGELAVMANDGTKSPVDLNALQYEFSQMQRTIQSITTGPDALAKFNGIPLFQGGTLFSPDSMPVSTPDLTVSSQEVVGRDSSGALVSWGDLLQDIAGLETADSAAWAGAAVSQAVDFLGAIRADLGTIAPNYLGNPSSASGHLIVQV